MISQEQYLVLQQRIRTHSVKIELLNDQDNILDSFEGYSLSGSLSMQSDSAYRRSGSFKMLVNSGVFIPSPESSIWFNRRIRIYIGLNNFLGETIWFNQGMYIMKNISIENNNKETTVDIQISDLMTLLDGTLNGNISHELKVIAQGNLVSDEIRQALALIGKVSVDNIEIEGLDAKVPYQIIISPDTTIYQHVKTLMELYYGMEMFYDDDGFLIIRKIRDRKSDPILWDFTSEGLNLIIDSTSKSDFENVRNTVYLWGRKKDTGETVNWMYRNRFSRQTESQMVSISNAKKGDICHVIEENKSYYWDNTWRLLDFTVSPIYNVESIGEKVFAHTDETISTVEQAMLRSEFELKKRNHMSESVSMSCVPLYGLNPNDKIYIVNKKNGIEGEYLVKSLSFGMSYSDTMSIEAEKIQY